MQISDLSPEEKGLLDTLRDASVTTDKERDKSTAENIISEKADMIALLSLLTTTISYQKEVMEDLTAREQMSYWQS